MKKTNIQRRLLSELMKSNYYFNIPLKKRLEFIKFFSIPHVFNLLCECNDNLINSKADFNLVTLIKPLITTDIRPSFSVQLMISSPCKDYRNLPGWFPDKDSRIGE